MWLLKSPNALFIFIGWIQYFPLLIHVTTVVKYDLLFIYFIDLFFGVENLKVCFWD